MTTVAVLGLGTMGAPIARRLLGAGHDVRVWNRTEGRAEPLARAGARTAATPADAARDVEIVITMLADPAAVESVLLGPDGAAAAMRPGACVVEMSTIGPTAVLALAAALPTGIGLVDAPVGGSLAAAEDGQLRVLVGGDAAVVDRVEPVLAALGTVRRCGGSGTGAALKLVLNTALVLGVTALADCLAVASATGVDQRDALELLGSGPLGAAVQRATATGASFAIGLAAKDARLALGELAEAPAPLLQAAAHVLAAAPDPATDLATIVLKELR